VKTKGDISALVWKDRRKVYMLSNMDPLPAEGKFCDYSNRLHSVERYNRHVGYVDNSVRTASSYSVSRRNFGWTSKLFFQLLDLSVLNSWIILPLYGAKYTHRDFRLFLVRNLIEEAARSQHRPTPPRGCLEGQMRPQQMSLGSKAAITNTGRQNSPNSTAVLFICPKY
jgi:hypothetical protein